MYNLVCLSKLYHCQLKSYTCTTLCAFPSYTTASSSHIHVQSCLPFQATPLPAQVIYMYNLVCLSKLYHCQLKSYTCTVLSTVPSYTTASSSCMYNLVCHSKFHHYPFTQSCLHFSVLPLNSPILYTILSAFLSFTTVCSNPLHNLVCISQFYH